VTGGEERINADGSVEKNRRFANAINELTFGHAMGADVEAKLGRWIYL